jgi:pimeloyl-ACP methyl ester carboxylesterase
MPVSTTTDTAALIPGAQVVLIEDAGHYLPRAARQSPLGGRRLRVVAACE